MNRDIFFKEIKKSLFFGRLSQTQVDGMSGLIDAFLAVGDGSRKTLAYGLATARREVGSPMVPVREGFAKSDTGARRAVAALAKKRGPRSNVAKYAKPAGPYGHVYYGRGYVQLTWLDNYEASSKDAGGDLVRDPDKALDPEFAARLLFLGIQDGRWNREGKGIAFYLNITKTDLMNARRTVNVTDHWQEISEHYEKFLAAIDAAGGVPKVVSKSPPAPAVAPARLPDPPAKPAPNGFAAWLSAFFKSLFGKKGT